MKSYRFRRWVALIALMVPMLPVAGAVIAEPASPERGTVEHLGTVSFAVSCRPEVRGEFSRGVALLHDFWYDEARPQFERILVRDPSCAMAHWGVAMSVFHQIWDRPDDPAIATASRELLAARARPAMTARERAYIAALTGFFDADGRSYATRIEGYSAAMGEIFAQYPKDIDAGAFYALSVLAAERPDDTSLRQEHAAMQILTPLFAAHPDHPGVVHYIIHACDTPALAADALVAARHYGTIAGSAPHAAHMPGHIFARLGLWQEDIAANRASVAASKFAEARGESGAMDQFHSDDFLLYAYLQSGQDEPARALIGELTGLVRHFSSMTGMADHYMMGMFPYYRSKLPIFLALETRDWKTAAELEPASSAPPETQTQVYWARVIADGHLRRAERATLDLAAHDALVEEIKKGRHAYYADSTGARITREEMLAWTAFASGQSDAAISQMGAAADLQDQVGQGEVDIPAREMLGDMLLELGRPGPALAEYERSLRLSPNRFNGLFNAGMAAEAAGDRARATGYYATLLRLTDDGAHTARAEIAHARDALAADASASLQ
jgi:tetratricopeptide (TPR) repeat protein